MITFTKWLKGPSMVAEDSRVLIVGVICTALLFTIVSTGEEVMSSERNPVDLVSVK